MSFLFELCFTSLLIEFQQYHDIYGYITDTASRFIKNQISRNAFPETMTPK